MNMNLIVYSKLCLELLRNVCHLLLLMYPSPVNSLYVGRLAASPSVTSGSGGRWQHLPLVPELSPGWRSGSGSLRRGRAFGS